MRKMWKTSAILLIAALLLLSACSNKSDSGSASDAPSGAASGNSGDKVELTFWSWGESDIPGFDQWMDKQIQSFQNQNPNITIKVVKQSTDTLTGSFQQTAVTNSGPDIATLWATIPVFTQMWNGYVEPISDHVPEEELKHWVNTSENTSEGKVWAMPIYLIGTPIAYNKELFKQAGLDAENPPKTWDEFLKACEALKAKGITPIGMGNKDGYAGAWMFSNLGKQNLNSMDEMKQVIVGDADILDPKYTEWFDRLAELANKGYFNDDIASLDLSNGWKLFPNGKAAMSWSTDGNVISWLKQMGPEKVGIMKTPVYGKGELAQAHTATQSASYFITKWSEHKEEAAKFLTFLHTKESLSDFYTTTGAFPADDRFDTGLIQDQTTKTLFEWDTTGTQVWAENYLPPMVDQNANIAGAQMIITKSRSIEEVRNLWKTTLDQWRNQHPEELDSFKKWK